MTNILIRKLDDHGILMKFYKSSANILIRLEDDHEILKDFDQNNLHELDDRGILILDFDQISS